jgi:hypothetical protein
MKKITSIILLFSLLSGIFLLALSLPMERVWAIGEYGNENNYEEDDKKDFSIEGAKDSFNLEGNYSFKLDEEKLENQLAKEENLDFAFF